MYIGLDSDRHFPERRRIDNEMLSPKFEQALHYAALIHAGQIWKGTEIPYLAHLVGVARIALEHNANEDEAIGALLPHG
jgi:(p)ppGpp synthase/HD superfamily hydrolase